MGTASTRGIAIPRRFAPESLLDPEVNTPMSTKNRSASDQGPGQSGEPSRDRQAAQAGGTTRPPSLQAPSPPVVLRGRFQKPIVLGTEVPLLNPARYAVIAALIDAGEEGLSKGKLHAKSKHPEPQKILKRLRKADENWAAVIQMAGSPGLG